MTMPNAGPAAEKPGIVVTLFGRPDFIQGMVEQLAAQHGLSPVAGAEHIRRSAEEALWLRRLSPPANGDSDALQISFNPPDADVQAGWLAGRERLEALLPRETLESDRLWGYTLIYLAERVGEGELEPLSAPALPLHSQGERAYSLLDVELPEGRLTLTHAPTGQGPEAATVYLAVAHPGAEAALNRFLLSPTAPLLMPELVTHKGYWQFRRYRHTPRFRSAQSAIDQLAAATKDVLDHPTNRRQSAAQLERLARCFDAVVAITPDLDEIRIELRKQQVNLKQYSRELPGQPLFERHLNALEIFEIELELLATRGRQVLDAASTTVEVVQTRVAGARASQERLTQYLLALLGVALALPEAFDKSAAAALLQWLGVECPAAGCSAGLLLLTQLVVGLAVGILAVLLVWLIGRRYNTG